MKMTRMKKFLNRGKFLEIVAYFKRYLMLFYRTLRFTESKLERLERRTALSLRPICLSYTDPHSPLNYNGDSDGEHGIVFLEITR